MTAAVTVLVPRALTSIVGGERSVQVPLGDGATVADLLDALASEYPVLGRRVRDETGALRRYVNLYVGGEDVRVLRGVATVIGPGQEVQILQSVAGG